MYVYMYSRLHRLSYGRIDDARSTCNYTLLGKCEISWECQKEKKILGWPRPIDLLATWEGEKAFK